MCRLLYQNYIKRILFSKRKKIYTFALHTNLTIINMKKTIVILFFALICFSSFAQEQEEGISRGDMELSFNGLVFTTVGTDYNITMGNIFVSYGRYFTKGLLVGLAPGVTITSADGETSADFSFQVFSTYNFMVDKKLVPYTRLSFYQQSVDIQDGAPFTDYSFIQGGGGFKMFFTPQVAWDTSLNVGVSLSEHAEGAVMMLLTGIAFKF